jgi:hypothetical protein
MFKMQCLEREKVTCCFDYYSVLNALGTEYKEKMLQL